MKNWLLLGCIFFFVGCKTTQKTVVLAKEDPIKKEEKTEKASPALVLVRTDEVSLTLKNKAYSLGKRVLMTCNTSRFKPFTNEEATPKVIKNTTQERLTQVCHKFRVRYGEFKDITLEEVIHDQSDGSYIFRFKAKYERDFAKKELRVTMDKSQKVSAIKSTDWEENFL